MPNGNAAQMPKVSTRFRIFSLTPGPDQTTGINSRKSIPNSTSTGPMSRFPCV